LATALTTAIRWTSVFGKTSHSAHRTAQVQSPPESTQDGRELRRYCRRWKVERLFAWLHNFRRLVSRWEYHEANFLGMLQLGCLVILLRHS